MILEGGVQARSPRAKPSSHSPATGHLGRGPRALSSNHTHMSGFSCKAENWSSILGRRGGVSLIEQVSVYSLAFPYQMPRPATGERLLLRS